VTSIRGIYLDYAATTTTGPEALEAMMPYFYGQESMKLMLSAHGSVAQILGCSPDEIFFTGSGTEANNSVIKGVTDAARRKDNHVITCTVEHHVVLEL
jgi:cysteine desulfurase